MRASKSENITPQSDMFVHLKSRFSMKNNGKSLKICDYDTFETEKQKNIFFEICENLDSKKLKLLENYEISLYFF